MADFHKFSDELIEAKIDYDDTAWRRSQVQGFRYGSRHVVRDLNLPAGEQEVFSITEKAETPLEYERCNAEVMEFIELYQFEMAFGHLIKGPSDDR